MQQRTASRSPARPLVGAPHVDGPRGASRGAGRSNRSAQDQLGDRSAGPGRAPAGPGPFSADWLNGALATAFGMGLDGLDARFGETGANDALGAQAQTEGQQMRFGGGVDADPAQPQAADPAALEIIAHETAHALAGGGSGQAALDGAGDPGEATADQAGQAFRRWAESGFEGPVPSLKPAQGGKASIHRYSSDASTLTGSPMLRRGSSGDLVKTLQAVLNAHGASLTIDGIFGTGTEAAVINVQSSHGSSVDGIVGPETAAALQGGASSSGTEVSSTSVSTSSVTGSPLLMRGSTGALVQALQTLLNSHGASLTVDGDFGAQTYAAVTGFQSANGLTVDGQVGPQTASKLNSSSAKGISSGSSGTASKFAGTAAYDSVRDAVLAAAESHLGALYWWGGDGPSYFDCSGFVLYVLRQDTGLVSWGDDTAGGIKNRLPSTNSPKKGDPVFFSSGGSVEHVMLATGSGSGTIGASGGGSHTFGDDPNAKVKNSDWNNDSRPHSFGSIEGLVDGYLAAHASNS